MAKGVILRRVFFDIFTLWLLIFPILVFASFGYGGGTTVDTTPPSLDSVLTSLPSGTYKIGDSIPLSVIFSENVMTNSGLTVQVSDGDESAIVSTCTIPVISNSNVVNCNFIVAEGENFDTGLNVRKIITSLLTDVALNELASPAFAAVTIYPIKTLLVDADRPVITLIGNTSTILNQGVTYVDLGATAFDSLDGDITNNIVTVNTVDVNNPGVYVVTYNVNDAAGNAAIQISRTVTVNGSVSSGGGGSSGGSGGGPSVGGGSLGGGSSGGGSSSGGGGSLGGGSYIDSRGVLGTFFDRTGSKPAQSFTGLVNGLQSDFVIKLINQINLLKEYLIRALAKQAQAPEVIKAKALDIKVKTPNKQLSLSEAGYLDKLCAFRYGEVGPHILWLQRRLASFGSGSDVVNDNANEGVCWSDEFDRLVRNIQLTNGILSPENPEFGCIGRATLDWLNSKDKNLKLYYNLRLSKPLNRELLSLYPCFKNSKGENFASDSVLEVSLMNSSDYTGDVLSSYFGRLNNKMVTIKTVAVENLGKSLGTCLIKEGDEGPAIKQLQKSLNASGFLISNKIGGFGSIGNETEKFASATAASLRAYQASRGLEVSGCLDKKTLDLLQGEKARSINNTKKT